MKLKYLVAGTFALVLSGCAVVKKQPFNAELNQHVETVAVVSPVQPEEVRVVIVNHPGMSFGLIGGIVAAAQTENATGDYSEALANAGIVIDWNEQLLPRVKSALEKAGYQVELVEYDGKRDDKAIHQEMKNKQTDAYLVLNYGVSYLAATTSTDYLPQVYLGAKLVDRASGEILFYDTFAYGYPQSFGEPIQISSDPKYAYPDLDALEAAPEESSQALLQGVELVAEKVGLMLNKKAVVDVETQSIDVQAGSGGQ